MIDFRPIIASDLIYLRSWFEDRELSRRLSYPTAEWFTYVTDTDVAQCWIAEQGNEPVAQLQVDHFPGEPAYLDIAVRPSFRGKGLGRSILSAFLDGPGEVYSVLVGHIEPDNFASLHCCQKCGFSLSDTADKDGFIKAELKRDRRA
jgi:RimJ/RimL family protein N-acetyltransferase